jgi:putative ABC transport system substrate-binding protein
MLQLRAGAVVISPESLSALRSEQLGSLALHHAVPAIAPYREFAAAGGLMSYGTNITNLYRQVGVYKIEFAVNLKTAKSLGLGVPRTLIARADEVIE